ncbi:MAG: response regulator transcription factor [Burkholderiaceae bacterium]|jgi:DNA-binding NarL/FixJ family response regulator|tara:strand:- start:275 stop:871 length:597 start_codon:yes stop_codon:yes gene_type:complete
MSILVIDDHPLMREAVVMLLRRLRTKATVIELDRLAVVNQAIVEHGTPELVCLDLKLPDTNGVSGVRELRRLLPDTSLIVLSASPATDYSDLALEAGADAYVEKSLGAAHIGKVLKEFLEDDDEDDADGPTIPEKLSKRQKQLLVMLDRGLSNRDIAESLSISEHTVKVHLWRLFRRLNVKSRSQASHLARTAGLIDY